MKNLLLLIICIIIFSGCTPKEKSVVARFQGDITEQKWSIRDLNTELPSDWSKFGYLTFDYKASSTQRFYINVFDTEGRRRLRILPFQGAWVRASIPLINFQFRNVVGRDMAAIGQKGFPGYGIGFTSAVGTINNVDSLGIFMETPIGTQTLELRNVRLTMAAEDSILRPVPLVDEFGQWIPDEWPRKATSLDDLKTDWSREEGDLQTGDFNFSKYGGYMGDKARATGFFRVEKIDDIWWFVDPEGYLFFSVGSCGMRPRVDFARVQGREYIYKALPPAELATVNQTTGVTSNTSFYTWNLFRRFGQDWNSEWVKLTARRMDNWGLNTVGGWIDTLDGNNRKVYVMRPSGWGIETGVMGMPDVYASDYSEMVDAAAARQCAPLKNDPYLLGYFIGNEPPWPGREQEFVRTVLEGNDTPMKAALVKYLSEGDTPEKRQAFVYDTYSKFLSIVNAAVKKHDPNHLNLGIRYGGNPPDELIRASKGFDVFSINIYAYDPVERLTRIYDLTGLPIIIGEFHFGTPGRGLSPGLRQTISQEERGVAYRYYVENAAAHPGLIGTHWFIWTDQPCTGRGDGENYNIGFVDVTDRPYKELIDAARETHKRIPDVHSGKIPPVTRQAKVQ